jgi:hypothetical protein
MKKLILAVDGNHLRLTTDRYEVGTPTHEVKNAYDIGLPTGHGIYSNVAWQYINTLPGTYNIAIVQTLEDVMLPDGWVGKLFMRLIHTEELKPIGTIINAGDKIYSAGEQGAPNQPHIHIEFTKTYNGTIGAGTDAQNRSLPVDGFTEVNIEDAIHINGATTLGNTFGHNIQQIDNDNVEGSSAPAPDNGTFVATRVNRSSYNGSFTFPDVEFSAFSGDNNSGWTTTRPVTEVNGETWLANTFFNHIGE